MLSKVIHCVNVVSVIFNNVACGVLAGMMFFVFVDVTMRYCFNRPIWGSFEITLLMMGPLCFSLAYAGVRKAHIRVDVLVSHLPQRAQAIIESVLGLAGLGIIFLIASQNILYMEEAFYDWRLTESLEVPLFPFIGLISIGFILFGLALLVQFLESVLKAVRK